MIDGTHAKDAEIGGSIKEKFDRMTSAVFVDYKGLNVEAGHQAPRRVPQERRRVPVVKNTLIKHALKRQAWATRTWANPHGHDRRGLELRGARAPPPRSSRRSRRTTRSSGQGRPRRRADPRREVASRPISRTMPGKDELRAQLLATLQAPLRARQLLNAPGRRTSSYLLKAKEDQEKAGAPSRPDRTRANWSGPSSEKVSTPPRTQRNKQDFPATRKTFRRAMSRRSTNMADLDPGAARRLPLQPPRPPDRRAHQGARDKWGVKAAPAPSLSAAPRYGAAGCPRGADGVQRRARRRRREQDQRHQGGPRDHRPRPQGGEGPRRGRPEGRQGGHRARPTPRT
jgi:large subunit ribosomal protein L10